MSKIYLAQSDTTVGFLSDNDNKLALAKSRKPSQKTLQTVDSLHILKEKTRVPQKYKKYIRRKNKTTFIYPNKKSFRVISKASEHYNFISKFHNLYSTSANKTQEKFDFNYAFNIADVIVFNKHGFKENKGSTIFKVSPHSIQKIR